MDNNNEYKLDNPIWYAISETHKDFGVQFDSIKFYHPDYCPFGGYINGDSFDKEFNSYSKLCSQFHIIGQDPIINSSKFIKSSFVCHQMIIHNPINHPITDTIVKLKGDQLNDLIQLVKLAASKSIGVITSLPPLSVVVLKLLISTAGNSRKLPRQ